MNPTRLQRVARRLGITRAEAKAVLAEAIDELRAGNAPRRPTAPFRLVRHEADDDRPTGYVRVPFFSKSEDAAPLRRVLTHAAAQSGLSPYLAATLMTHVWRGVADEVGRGNVVRVPGWGVYGPWLWTPKDGGPLAVYPRFVAARPFRQQVRDCCPPEDAKNDVLRTFQRSHHPSSRPDQSGTRTSTTMAAWRADIDRQAGYTVRGTIGHAQENNGPTFGGCAGAQLLFESQGPQRPPGPLKRLVMHRRMAAANAHRQRTRSP